MSKILVYHNGECNKSNSATQILREKGIDFDVRYYMMEPLSEKELTALVDLLGVEPEDLIRKNETLYIEQFSEKKFTGAEWIQILAAHPELMQRPIVVKDGKAIIARPPEKVLEILHGG